MQVKIQNAKLGQAIDLLFNLALKGKQSRHRTKFINVMNNRLKEVAEQEKVLLKEHCHLDEKGEPKTKDEKYWDLKDVSAFTKDKNELYEEELVIDGGDAQGYLKTVKKVLEDCDVAFSGQEAMIYDYLCEQFEGDEL